MPLGIVGSYDPAPVLGTAARWRAVWWAGAGIALVAFILYGTVVRLPPSLVVDYGREPADPTDRSSPRPCGSPAKPDIWPLALAFAYFNIVLTFWRRCARIP